MKSNNGLTRCLQHEGEWQNNQLHGRCRYTQPDGSIRDRVYVSGVETDQPCDMGYFFSQLKCTDCIVLLTHRSFLIYYVQFDSIT